MISEPQGQAALLLCEALIHLMVEHDVIDKRAVCSTIEGVEEVKAEMAHEEPAATAYASIALLKSIRQSLAVK